MGKYIGKIKTAIIDDEKLTREGLDIILSSYDDIEVTSLGENGYKVLELTTFQDTEYIKDALENGAFGYLLKDSSYDLIYQAIKASLGGNIVIHPDVAKAKDILNSNSENVDLEVLCNQYSLDKKEIEIIRFIADGLTNKEIGDEFFLSEGTIKNRVGVILSKLNLNSRTSIVSFSFKNKISR